MFMKSIASDFKGSRDNYPHLKLVKIGSGTFGSVYFTTASPEVYKKCRKLENSQLLVQEFYQLQKIHKALSEADSEILCPTPYELFKVDDEEFWNDPSLSFPRNDSDPTCAFSMSRVYPLPIPVKARLIELFCPEQLKKGTDVRKGHHLARLLLGRADSNDSLSAPRIFFNTYNFPLTRRRAEELGIDTEKLAIEMGRLLARLHMSAKVDGRDIEIVLGANITSTVIKLCESRAWVIDFNQVQDFNFTADGVKMLVDAFYCNEAYFPRARPSDTLYQTFKRAYQTECTAFGEEARSLGDLFIVALEAEQVEIDSRRKRTNIC